MKKIIEEFQKVELKSYKDKKEELDDFFNSMIMQPADYQHLDLIKSKKVDFLNWLKSKWLDRLLTNFNLVEPITEFEWECRQQILTYIAKFDLYMIQCMRNNIDSEHRERMDICLRKDMSEFDKYYYE